MSVLFYPCFKVSPIEGAPTLVCSNTSYTREQAQSYLDKYPISNMIPERRLVPHKGWFGLLSRFPEPWYLREWASDPVRRLNDEKEQAY